MCYLFNHHSLRTTTAMAKKKITGAELAARVKANGYRRGAHRETAISMWTSSSGIEMQRWIVMSCEGGFVSTPETMNTGVGFQLAP